MNDINLSFENWLQNAVSAVDEQLEQALPAVIEEPEVLHEAMRYACLGAGKRVRAALVYAAGQACSTQLTLEPSLTQALSHAAAAVELIHAYSLVHDDLPCMDDDVMRRGKPTLHIAYGESLALLAADAMQPLAFEQLSNMPVAPALIVQAIQVLARASGSLGMVGGQVIDTQNTDQIISIDKLQQMHRLKTGAMIEGSVLMGAICAAANFETRNALEAYGAAIGLAFQVVDDILDVTADSQELGKTAGKDAQNNKPTYVSIMGLEESKAFAEQLYQAALQSILPLGPQASRLRELAHFIIRRDN